jgi:hypothetical protein
MQLSDGVLIAMAGVLTSVVGGLMARRTAKESHQIDSASQAVSAWKDIAITAREEAAELREQVVTFESDRVKAETAWAEQIAALRSEVHELEMRARQRAPRRRPDTPPPTGG